MELFTEKNLARFEKWISETISIPTHDQSINDIKNFYDCPSQMQRGVYEDYCEHESLPLSLELLNDDGYWYYK